MAASKARAGEGEGTGMWEVGGVRRRLGVIVKVRPRSKG